MAASFWEQSINVFGGALAEPDPMPAGVAAATVTGTIGLALLLKVLAIAAKRQPIPGLAGAARRHLADLEGVPDADAAAYRAYLATPSSERKPFALEAIRVPLAAARTCADGVELCGQADKQITGLIEADLQAAAAILHASAHAMLACVNANLAHMAVEDEDRRAYLEESRHVADKAEAAFALMHPSMD